jgi:GT2 family glycosyltransferase
MRYAEFLDVDWYWLLNNDTLVQSDTLIQLIQSAAKAVNPGVWGSKILDFDPPHGIQALAGYVHPFWARPEHILDEAHLHKMSYVVGASFLISKKCYEELGGLPEDYFLYFEETAYCALAQKKGFEIGIALDSVIYHKSGVSSDSPTKLYYYHRNLLWYNIRFTPWRLLNVIYYITVSRILKMLWLRQPGVLVVLKGVGDFIMGKTGPSI